MKIIDTIFGKKHTISYPILGIVTSDRIKGNDQTKKYGWYGTVFLNSKSEATAIIMEGDNTSPFFTHLNSVIQIIEKWESRYFKEIEMKLVEKGINSLAEYSNWKNDFYVGSIIPKDDRKANFELIFEPLNSKSENYIVIEYKNSAISKIEIK